METKQIGINQLHYFTPFESLEDEQLGYIVNNAQIMNVASGKLIIEMKSTTTDLFLLLEGDVKLRAMDDTVSFIKAHSERSKAPIAQLRPSWYHVTSYSECTILRITEECLDAAIEIAEPTSSFTLQESSFADEHEEERILYELIMDLQHGDFILPSLPSVATQVQESIASEDSSVHDIAKIIMNDPSIAVKIIKASNSALYQKKQKIQDCKTAVINLGTKTTNQLVNSYVLKELFSSPNKLLKKYMKELWEHSVEIAAISYVLAKVTPGMDAEQAMLAGLIHDIGNIAILNKAIEHPRVIDNEEYLKKVMSKMHAPVGGSILRSWEFSDEMVAVAEQAENWQHDKSSLADLVDIINIAHLHSYIGTAKQKEVPILDQVPAFHKMALGKLTPRYSLLILEKSHKKIMDTKNLLAY